MMGGDVSKKHGRLVGGQHQVGMEEGVAFFCDS